jgi:hypothetical protein
VPLRKSTKTRTHQHQVYADDVNLLRDNINAMQENTEAPIDTSKEAGLQESTEKTKNMLMPHHQNAGQNHNINIANRSFENEESSDIWEQC